MRVPGVPGVNLETELMGVGHYVLMGKQRSPREAAHPFQTVSQASSLV